MKTKSVITSGVEVLSATQLSRIKGGKDLEVIINGKKVIITIPD